MPGFGYRHRGMPNDMGWHPIEIYTQKNEDPQFFADFEMVNDYCLGWSGPKSVLT